MLVFFFPFFENLGSYVYDSMRARVRVIVFERHQRSDYFVEKLYGMRARALAVHACPLARGRPRRLLLSDSEAAPQSRKSRVADKKQTDRQTNTHYSFIGIDRVQSSFNLKADRHGYTDHHLLVHCHC